MKNEASEEAHFTSRIFQNQQQLSSFYLLLSFQGFEVQSYPHISFLRPADIRSVLSKYIYFPFIYTKSGQNAIHRCFHISMYQTDEKQQKPQETNDFVSIVNKTS